MHIVRGIKKDREIMPSKGWRKSRVPGGAGARLWSQGELREVRRRNREPPAVPRKEAVPLPSFEHTKAPFHPLSLKKKKNGQKRWPARRRKEDEIPHGLFDRAAETGSRKTRGM